MSVPGMGRHLGDDMDEDEDGYEYDRHDTKMNKEAKRNFWNSIKSETFDKFRFKDVPNRNRRPKSLNGGVLKPDTIAPPLRGQLRDGRTVTNGKSGFTKSRSTPEDVVRMGRQNPRGEQFEVKTWENAEGGAADDEDEVDESLQIMWPPKQEPPSGTSDHRVQEKISATLTTMAYAKPNGGAAANGHANGASGTPKKGKKKKKVTKDLLAEAFGAS